MTTPLPTPVQLPKPRGSAITWALKECKVPHTPLSPSQHYSLSELSDNCRSNSATFLRCHLPKKSLRERLRFLTKRFPAGDYMLVGRQGGDITVGLIRRGEEVEYLDPVRELPLGDGAVDGDHPLELAFDSLDVVYFMCAVFDERHLVRPLLYRRRKSRQLKKVIDKRDGVVGKRKMTSGLAAENGQLKKNQKKKKKSKKT